ncbi:MAG: hypothetical protein R2827_08975 [Bdellovibrionales bacterium]
MRSNLYEDKQQYEKVRDALIVKAAIEYSQSKDGSERLANEWGITGLWSTNDSDYDEAVNIFNRAKRPLLKNTNLNKNYLQGKTNRPLNSSGRSAQHEHSFGLFVRSDPYIIL